MCAVSWGGGDGSVQYRGGIVSTVGGYLEYRGSIMMHVGDIMSTVRVFITVGKNLLSFEYPHGTEHPTVLMISPHMYYIPHGTQDIPQMHHDPHDTDPPPPPRYRTHVIQAGNSRTNFDNIEFL